MKRMIMIMADGFGIPPEGWDNSVFARFGKEEFAALLSSSPPLDTRLGVPGIPQSATGQTALFTGINAPMEMGGHIQGFPGPALRSLIRRSNIFAELKTIGLKVAFANAYVKHDLAELAKLKRRSVTTVMTESVLGEVRRLEELLYGDAVYHDLTRSSLTEEFEIEPITPEKAAEHLAEIADENDFTLFEYFLTDMAGHRSGTAIMKRVLGEFSAFFMRLLETASDETAILLTSDHGNCESPDTRGHTTNPVPLFTSGFPLIADWTPISIAEVPDFILRHFRTEERKRI